jgi:glycosyltransferase involved in cell wall biosynthesis
MKISIILAPRIGAIGKELAGTEGMFLSDLVEIKKRFDIRAFARFYNREPKIERVYYPSFILKTIYYLKFLKKYYDRIKELGKLIADIVYVFSAYFKSLDSQMIIGYSSAMVALLPFKKRVIFLHSYEIFYFSWLFYSQYKNCSYIFCSKYLMNYYIKKYNFITPENSTLLYNAVDSKKFFPVKRKSRDRNITRLLFVSAWVKQKGLHLLLESILKQPTKIRKKLSLTIASSKNLWYIEKIDSDKKYIEKIDNLLVKIPDVVLLDGVEHKDMNELYNQADFLVFPSTWGEPCSLSLIESVFAGLPVIAFDVGGNHEILSKQNSILINSKSARSLTRILVEVANKEFYFKRSLTTKKNRDMLATIRTPKFLKLINDLSSN